ncbi:hypothetical protein EVAR_66344_1 [Eumeta japonica]|uniref:Uncharacterized protein n=1 Tax=Eumeta variegata TaxID=151549 RepID=A0A4C2A398_EUMVA|nr:hypothetical protein EVAR_66344_1 [Eumeta japonica]
MTESLSTTTVFVGCRRRRGRAPCRRPEGAGAKERVRTGRHNTYTCNARFCYVENHRSAGASLSVDTRPPGSERQALYFALLFKIYIAYAGWELGFETGNGSAVDAAVLSDDRGDGAERWPKTGRSYKIMILYAVVRSASSHTIIR